MCLDVVWSDAKQMKLVDSLYHNYYVPPIVLAVMLDEEGIEVRRCVDGKQRLTSIQKFIDGQVSLTARILLYIFITYGYSDTL